MPGPGIQYFLMVCALAVLSKNQPASHCAVLFNSSKGWKKCLLPRKLLSYKHPKFPTKLQIFLKNTNISWEGASKLPHFFPPCSSAEQENTFLSGFLHSYEPHLMSVLKCTPTFYFQAHELAR